MEGLPSVAAAEGIVAAEGAGDLFPLQTSSMWRRV